MAIKTKRRGHRPAKPGAPMTILMTRVGVSTLKQLASLYRVDYRSVRSANRDGRVPAKMRDFARWSTKKGKDLAEVAYQVHRGLA